MSGPEPYWSDPQIALHLGKCEDVLPLLAPESVDAIVTDPPAAVSFMGREWDSDRGGRDRWVGWLAGCMESAVRCLKPGGHALVWSLPRTAHWTAWALEDAGLEIRDCIPHLFGSGFPKSLDVSKAIDKGKRRDYVAAAVRLGMEIPGRNLDDWTKEDHSPGDLWWAEFKDHLSVAQWSALEREVVAHGQSGAAEVAYSRTLGGAYEITAPATEDAARWEGWGTALKPGQEMWWLARKPFEGNVAANVLQYGTGALNVAGCRVGTNVRMNNAGGSSSLQRVSRVEQGYRPTVTASVGAASEVAGRWPPNLVLTHSAACGLDCASDCPAAELDRQSGNVKAGGSAHGTTARSGTTGAGIGPGGIPMERTRNFDSYGDSGGASRFFPVFRYQAKAPSSERPRLVDGTAHSTVKPVSLMQWLVRLVTPPGGLVLDCFAGTGTTAEACIVEGFRCVLIEQDPASAELIRTRLRKDIQPGMFGGAA